MPAPLVVLGVLLCSGLAGAGAGTLLGRKPSAGKDRLIEAVDLVVSEVDRHSALYLSEEIRGEVRQLAEKLVSERPPQVDHDEERVIEHPEWARDPRGLNTWH